MCLTNAPITKEQTNFRSINHEYDTVTTNKLAICNSNDEDIQDDGGTRTYYYRYLFKHKTFRW